MSQYRFAPSNQGRVGWNLLWLLGVSIPVLVFTMRGLGMRDAVATRRVLQ